ncbi:MAG: hypothetical protein QXQ18_00900 [Candidatus Aenigmatarchaeota archaeon]
MDKLELLRQLQQEIKKLPEKDRNRFFGKFFVSIISALTKRLIKYEGYSATHTILQREINAIGRRDAKEIVKVFGINDKTPESVSKVLKIAALLLGYELDVENGETIVKECPFAVMARETKEPRIAEICSWYCNGIAEEILGPSYLWKGYHDYQKDIPKCYFKAVKRK